MTGQGFTKIVKNYSLGAMNINTHFHDNPASCSEISLWSKVLHGLTDKSYTFLCSATLNKMFVGKGSNQIIPLKQRKKTKNLKE